MENKKVKKPEKKERKRLTPHECALLARGYEECALEIQEKYVQGASVPSIVKIMLGRANFIRAGKVE